jgi:hypothetical protein
VEEERVTCHDLTQHEAFGPEDDGHAAVVDGRTKRVKHRGFRLRRAALT